jgi:menaquinone-9 beta-reductase
MATDADVVVVGAGASGAAAAAFLAEGGLRVIGLERRKLAEAGARWVNGVPRASFARAGVAISEGAEHQGGPDPFHVVVAPSARAKGGSAGEARPTSLILVDHDVIHVDMRLLVARLQARAQRAGVRFHEGVTAQGWRGGMSRAHHTDDLVLETSQGPFAARWFIDASGLTGARLLGQPAVARVELCAAAQEVREVVDAAAARRFLEGVGARPGEAIGFLGVAGGYSVLNVHVAHDLRTVGVLTGSLPALGHPSGKAILDHFVAEHAWVGAARFGGAAAIPLRRPYDRLASERVALLGDAGCQVFPAHGSGVGSGLVAARLLADTILAGQPLRDYEVAWQREHGALMASFDVMRRWSQSLDGAAVGRMIAFGLAEPAMMKAGLNQELPQVSLGWLLRMAPGMARAMREDPALGRSMAVAGARSRLAHALYARYPRQVKHVASWSRAIDRLIGA